MKAWSITLHFHEDKEVTVNIAQIRAKFQKLAALEGGFVDNDNTDEDQVCIIVPGDEATKTIIMEYGKIGNTSIYLDHIDVE